VIGTGQWELRRKWLVGAGLLLALIFVFTHLPEKSVPQVCLWGTTDKSRHVIVYGFLTFMLLKGLGAPSSQQVRKLFLGVVVIAGLGLLDELTQTLVGRTCSLQDWLANMLGASLASLTAIAWPADGPNR
jgi:VanZ family protein